MRSEHGSIRKECVRAKIDLNRGGALAMARSRNPHGRSTFAMISANCVAGRDRGKGLPVLSARQFIGAATTALSLITGTFLLALAAGDARAQGAVPACDAAGEIALLPSPWAPWKGAPLRVMLVTEKPLQGELCVEFYRASTRQASSTARM